VVRSSAPACRSSVLLICPGVFAFHARWKGLSIETLLRQAGADDRTTHVDVRGPTGPYAKLQRFPMRAVRSGQAFLAYAVNGRNLPRQHGYPLRAVSEDDVGSEWIKYADTVEAVIVENAPRDDRPPGSGPPVFVP
jgi:DMSO/TMAO reductase YedYZ molybdopterin-dependent catalytic subunit